MKHLRLKLISESNLKNKYVATIFKWMFFVCSCLLMLDASAVVRRVIPNFINSTGLYNGASWSTAYRNLQVAIDASVSGDEIWLCRGFYYPNSFGNYNYFSMKSGVKIYGGFDGEETLLSQRDWVANPTTLYQVSQSYPVIHNVNVSSTALLDGVNIDNAVIAPTNTTYNAAGMNNTGSSFPTISNVTFYNCRGVAGGALYVEGGNSAITNVTFRNNRSNKGGAVFFKNCTSTLTNVVFISNSWMNTDLDQGGGAVYSEESAPVYRNVVFQSNNTYDNGGAVYNINTNSMDTKKPTFTNVVFVRNRTSAGGYGGAVYNNKSQPTFTNCTFFDNGCGVAAGGGGVGTTSPSGTAPGDYPTATITNCLFYANSYDNGNTFVSNTDVYQQRGVNAITYSSFNEAGSYTNAGNVGTIASPFKNPTAPSGTDGVFFTVDDGLRLNECTAGNAIDKGNSNAPNLPTTDMSGLPRRFEVDLVADGGAGSSPIIDMGAYEDQTAHTLASVIGSIGTSHAVPFPQELATDAITSTQNPTINGSVVYSWQQRTSSTTWATIPGATNANYPLPSINQTTYYRRGVAPTSFCNFPFYSDSVVITVVQPNGVIEGQVTSNSGAPVEGITITATRLTAVSSGPANYTYPTVTTGADGKYTINNVYYGTQAAGANFRIVPSKATHNFNPSSLDRTITPNTSSRTGVDFKDTTVISIVGRTYQTCTTCNSVSGTVETQTCPIDSISIYKAGTYATTTGFISPDYGRYAVTVSDPITINIEPRLTGHSFNPTFRSVTPSSNLTNIDFADVTNRTITGKISAGCNNYIGIAVLEFTDVLLTPNGSPRASCFRKRVTTTNTGAFSITLPARKYRVRVISFTPAAGANAVVAADVVDFINTKVPADSLTRDITNGNATLNLVYQRPPVIAISGGLNIVCNTPTPFALLRQAAADSFKVFTYQGPAALGCMLTDTTTKIRIITNVHQEDQTQEFLFAVADTGTKVKLVGGTPNITGNHLKDLFVYFTDKYGRAATAFNRKVLVTGVKADAATFTTVSPEVPMVVLHDPPGDASYSTWQQSKSISNAVRFYTKSGQSTEGWAKAKIGAKFQLGLIVSTENSVWGTIGGNINVGSSSTSSDEAIVTTTTTQNFSTANNSSVTGTNGDVYVGAALNLVYAVATVINYNNCAVTSSRQLIMANNGFATQYIYSEDYILNTLIPNLQELATLSPDSATKYLNQVKVWQQVVNNNIENKRRAAFVQNYSFDGGVGAYTNTTTTSSTKTSTIEFVAEVNSGIAAELGFEIAGSGASGGVNVNFKMETGESESNTVTNETTIAYTLEDDDPGDSYSVNVKKDPVYNTPVFELVAGRASCPPEPGAQSRDDVYFTALNPVVSNVASGDYANFSLRIVNTSPSHETRTYKLAYDQGSNVANESVRIAGTDYTGIPITLAPLAYLDSVTVIVSIKRLPGSSVFSYEGERFKVLDACVALDSRLAKMVQVSAYYVAPCSNIALAQPADGWQLTSSGNNQIFIKPSGYNLATLSSVNLQFATGNSTNWNDGPFISTEQLSNGFNFDASTLPEGTVSIRLRLDCNDGTVYSGRSTGFIDRKTPKLFGRPDPTDDNYVNGDVIGFTYNETLNTNPANLQVTVLRLSNNQVVPATASIYENKVIITPTNGIAGLNSDSIRVIISGISDVYGNIKTTADSTRFIVGTTVVGTGNQALIVSSTNPSVYKNGDSTFNVFFNLPVNAVNDTRVNYTISGTARYGIDYTVIYSTTNASYANFNGSTGSLRIAGGSTQAVLRIKPIGGDTSWNPDKTVIISLAEGGDYVLGAITSAIGNITSEDGITTYTFTGDGPWNIKNNWLNGKMPLTTLIAPKEIIINPSGTCILNILQAIKPGAKITVKQNRRMIIQGNLKLD